MEILGVINSKKLDLTRITNSQHGYFTANQAIEQGYTDKHHYYHVRQNHWLKIAKGLFRLPGYPDSLESDFTKWYLWSRNQKNQPQGVISHNSALALYGLLAYNPDEIHLIVPLRFQKKAPSGVILHKLSLTLSAIESHGAFMATRLVRTLADLRPSLDERGIWRETVEKGLDSGKLTPAEARELGGPKAVPLAGDIRNAEDSAADAGASRAAESWFGLPGPADAENKNAVSPTRSERIYKMIFQRTQSRPGSRGRAQAGFTLVELLVVTAIISVLAAMLLPALDRTLAAARSAACRNNFKQIGYAIMNYAGDFGDCVIPYNNQFGIGWCKLAQPYLNNKLKNDDFNGVTLCPSTLRTSAAEGSVAFPVAMSYSGTLGCYDSYTPPSGENGGYFISWANLSKARPLRSICPGSVIFIEQNLEKNLIAAFTFPANAPYCYTVPDYTNNITGSSFNTWGAAYRHDKQGNFLFVDLSVRSFTLGQKFSMYYWRPID